MTAAPRTLLGHDPHARDLLSPGTPRRLVLLGAGHAHAQLLRAWTPRPDVELVLVSPEPLAPYSGMVPGWLAGLYRFDEIVIDFVALAQAAGARFIVAEVLGLEADARRVLLSNGSTLDYDLLSLNVGSTLTAPELDDGTPVLALRPLAELHAQWNPLVAHLAANDPGDAHVPLTVTAVGGGAAGVESLLAALVRLRAACPGRTVRGSLVTRADTLVPGVAAGARRALRRRLRHAGVDVQLGTTWDPSASALSDLVLWATGAQSHGWQRESGLTVSEAGFIRIGDTLRSISHANVWAVGDCAEWAGRPLPKAGVFAVRMGPVLLQNLLAALDGLLPVNYVPQRRFLALLSTADRTAIASWGPFSATGHWVWRWKDRIDREFVDRFRLPRSTPADTGTATAATAATTTALDAVPASTPVTQEPL